MDEEILEQFVDGEEEALQIIMDSYSEPLLKYCYSILLNYHDAQDALQETFIKAYQKRDQFDAKTSLKAWLYRIAYTTALNILKKRKRYKIAVPENLKQEEYMGEALRKVLLALSEVERALLYGRVMEKQSYEELSERLGIRPVALRKRYERLKKKLEGKLSKEYPDYVKEEIENV